jgi:hypothetical protein
LAFARHDFPELLKAELLSRIRIGRRFIHKGNDD